MLGRIGAFVSERRQRENSSTCRRLATEHLVWALGSLCAFNRIPFDADRLLRAFPPPYSTDTLIHVARALGFRVKQIRCDVTALHKFPMPCLALLAPDDGLVANDTASATNDDTSTPLESDPAVGLSLLIEASPDRVRCFTPGTSTPVEFSSNALAARFPGVAFLVALERQAVVDPDGIDARVGFGFHWFVPALMKHRKVWRDILIASLVIQLLALGTPLFTQTIIDKVVVHRTDSTLVVIAVGMAVFMVFSATLGWLRQYLVLHTGNRVDAVLAAAVFDHLFRLPPRYFEHRPTGVIAARLHGVETIREFIASAAVSLVLDLPFLAIFVAIMFWYSVKLTLIALGILAAIVVLSLVVAPLFQAQLNRQFLLGARNQAFLTEYIAGVETVKSLQMEPQLKARFSDYLADYLHATFKTRQLANTYNTAATTFEQIMSLLILAIGAWTVMHGTEFTIGMLVAFQMFAGRLSQPMMRLVGLWQQFQQATLAVKRLGDVMNAPTEPYALAPTRLAQGEGRIEIEGLAFRHGEQLPYLYRGFDLVVPPGSTVAIMGPSGSGKSTFAKLLQGFYRPADGQIRIDGIDIRNLPANELRHHFGVVPQETVLFSGTIYDNLLAANPHASFDHIVRAAKLAEIHATIEALPNGYQTRIGERGAGLSGGQRQRLAIARALLKRPRILVFDEATSALDQHTAEQLAATINQLRGKVTMLFIAHALPRNLLVDEVVRLGGAHTSVLAGEPAGHPSSERTGGQS